MRCEAAGRARAGEELAAALAWRASACGSVGIHGTTRFFLCLDFVFTFSMILSIMQGDHQRLLDTYQHLMQLHIPLQPSDASTADGSGTSTAGMRSFSQSHLNGSFTAKEATSAVPDALSSMGQLKSALPPGGAVAETKGQGYACPVAQSETCTDNVLSDEQRAMCARARNGGLQECRLGWGHTQEASALHCVMGAFPISRLHEVRCCCCHSMPPPRMPL